MKRFVLIYVRWQTQGRAVEWITIPSNSKAEVGVEFDRVLLLFGPGKTSVLDSIGHNFGQIMFANKAIPIIGIRTIYTILSSRTN